MALPCRHEVAATALIMGGVEYLLLTALPALQGAKDATRLVKLETHTLQTKTSPMPSDVPGVLVATHATRLKRAPAC